MFLTWYIDLALATDRFAPVLFLLSLRPTKEESGLFGEIHLDKINFLFHA